MTIVASGENSSPASPRVAKQKARLDIELVDVAPIVILIRLDGVFIEVAEAQLAKMALQRPLSGAAVLLRAEGHDNG